MKLTVLSPERLEGREPTVIAQLFEAGLETYHVRKPLWSRTHLAEWLQTIRPEWRPRLILHTHYDLAAELGLGGIHFRDTENSPGGTTSVSSSSPSLPVPASILLSRACHDLATLTAALPAFDRLLLSPIFPSISKIDYGPALALTDIRAALHTRPAEARADVFALGGITPDRVAACAELGFDGVALLGAIWRAVDPLLVFRRARKSLAAHHAA